MIDGGAKLIQIRGKEMSASEFLDAAKAVMFLARPFPSVKIIINDRADIAKICGAHGVHLGQSDLPPAAARDLLGPQAIIGYSTHSVEQASSAAAMPVNYIAAGPVFGTSTKNDAEPVIGLSGLALIKAAIGDIPLVAIGGIDSENAASAVGAGANMLAVISAVTSATDISAAVAGLIQKISK